MFRKIIKVEKEEDLKIELPKEYLHKEVEITAEEVDDTAVAEKRKLAKEAIDFFNSISVDMSNFKFDRDEANER